MLTVEQIRNPNVQRVLQSVAAKAKRDSRYLTHLSRLLGCVESARKLAESAPDVVSTYVQQNGTVIPLRVADCVHLGDILSQTDKCGNPCNCEGLWLRECELYRTCRVNEDGADMNCQKCMDYESEKKVPPYPEIGVQPMIDYLRGPYEPGRHEWIHWPVTKRAFGLMADELIRYTPACPPVSGAGVVMAGGGKYDVGIYVGIRMLRHVGCDLPVQVWHRGTDEPVSAAVRELPNVSVHNLRTSNLSRRTDGGYQSKMDAMIASGFERLIFFDADAYPVADPTPLFDYTGPGGVIVWPDLQSTGNALQYHSYGLDPKDPIEPINSGHTVWHVPTAWPVMRLAHHFDHHPEYYYAHRVGVGGFGDQDQIRAALKLLNHPYTMFSKDYGHRPGCFVQTGWDGKPLWVHRCKNKLGPDGTWDDRHCATYRKDLPLEDVVWGFYREWEIAVGGGGK